MQIEELVGFLDWVDVEIKKSNIVELYQQLQTNLSKNSQPNQAKVSFETQKTNLINGILEVDLDALNNAQSSFAEKIGLLDLVGQKGKDFIEDTLSSRSQTPFGNVCFTHTHLISSTASSRLPRPAVAGLAMTRFFY